MSSPRFIIPILVIIIVTYSRILCKRIILLHCLIIDTNKELQKSGSDEKIPLSSFTTHCSKQRKRGNRALKKFFYFKVACLESTFGKLLSPLKLTSTFLRFHSEKACSTFSFLYGSNNATKIILFSDTIIHHNYNNLTPKRRHCSRVSSGHIPT